MICSLRRKPEMNISTFQSATERQHFYMPASLGILLKDYDSIINLKQCTAVVWYNFFSEVSKKY